MFKKIYKIGEQEVYKNYKEQCRQKHELKDLIWETTLTCNLKCKHCGSNAEGKKYDGELSTEEIKAAFKQIADDMDISDVLINVTGGEPMMRKDLFEVMEYATNELGFHWGMTSNGMLLNDENIEKLKKANMNTIAISIDGLEKTHDEFRGIQGSYKIVTENIKKMVASKYFNHVQVTTVFHKDNINQLDELYEVVKNLGVDSWRIASMDPIGRGIDNNNLLLDGHDIKKLLDFIKDKRKHDKFRVLYSCQGYLGLDYEREVRKNFFQCRAGISVASILYNGDLFVCTDVPRLPHLIQGNIRNDRFKDVWENKYEVYRNKERTKCDECEKCKNWDYCLGGAFHTWNFEENKQNRCAYKMIFEDK